MGENRQVEYAVVDVETTGLDPTRDRVIDIGILLVDSTGLVQGDWSSLVNPQRPVDATFIHGLTDEDVESAPAFSSLLPRVVELLRGRAVVAHNASFDIGFLNAEFARARYPVTIPRAAGVCTMDQSRIYLPPGRHNLAACLERAGITLPVKHRSIADAQCSAALLAHYLETELSGVRYADTAQDRHGNLVLPREWERAAEAARSIQWLDIADLGPATLNS